MATDYFDSFTDGVASFISLSGVASPADTDHGPQWQVVIHTANCIESTRSDSETGVFTDAIKTGMLAGTVSILLARVILFNRLGNYGKDIVDRSLCSIIDIELLLG